MTETIAYGNFLAQLLDIHFPPPHFQSGFFLSMQFVSSNDPGYQTVDPIGTYLTGSQPMQITITTKYTGKFSHDFLPWTFWRTTANKGCGPFIYPGFFGQSGFSQFDYMQNECTDDTDPASNQKWKWKDKKLTANKKVQAQLSFFSQNEGPTGVNGRFFNGTWNILADNLPPGSYEFTIQFYEQFPPSGGIIDFGADYAGPNGNAQYQDRDMKTQSEIFFNITDISPGGIWVAPDQFPAGPNILNTMIVTVDLEKDIDIGASNPILGSLKEGGMGTVDIQKTIGQANDKTADSPGSQGIQAGDPGLS